MNFFYLHLCFTTLFWSCGRKNLSKIKPHKKTHSLHFSNDKNPSYIVAFKGSTQENLGNFLVKESASFEHFIHKIRLDPKVKQLKKIGLLNPSAPKENFFFKNQLNLSYFDEEIAPKIVFTQIDFYDQKDAKILVKQWHEKNWIHFAEANRQSKLHAPLQNLKNKSPQANQWWKKIISLENALDLTNTNKNSSSETIVAVLDSGVDIEHGHLKEKIWTNPQPGKFHCGYDLHGCDTTSPKETHIGSGNVFPYGLTNYGQSCNYDESNTEDFSNCIHGTHVAGLIATSEFGICKNCKILPIKVVENIDGESAILDSSVLSALRYLSLLQRNGSPLARVVNMSFGKFHKSKSIELYIDYLSKKGLGTVFVASAGNENTNQESYPAAYANVISVSAVNKDATKSSYSNYGTWVNIAAPGGSGENADSMIISTSPGNSEMPSYGTSVAAPIVSGVLGLVLSNFKNLSAFELKNRLLRNTKEHFFEHNRKKSYLISLLGKGLVDASQILQNNQKSLTENQSIEKIPPVCGSIGKIESSSAINLSYLFFILIPLSLIFL